MSQHTPWPTLDLYARELLDAPARRAVDAHVHECAECTASLKRLRGEEEKLREALAPEDADEEAVEQVLRAAHEPPQPQRRFGALVPLLAAAALIAVVIVATVGMPTPPPSDPVTSAIDVYARGGDGSWLLRLGRKILPDIRRAETAAAGDARTRLASMRQKIESSLPRVLWIEADPRQEFTMLAPKLRDDQRFLVQTYVLENRECKASDWIAELPFRAPVSGFPAADLVDYDVFMLGKFVSTDAATIPAIETFVMSYGGGLLMIAGEKRLVNDVQSGCAALAPVTTQPGVTANVRVALTSAGRAHPATELGEERDEFFATAEPVRWYAQTQAKPEATVLVATKDGAPILTVWERGRGRVAHMATDDHWMWRAERQATYYRAVLNYLARRP